MSIYKSESLGHLEAWITDALNSDATSKEVYDTIVNTVKEEIEYHQRSLKRSQQLLVMLKGSLSGVYDVADSQREWQDHWNPARNDESFDETLKREGYEYTPLSTQDTTPNIPSRY